MDVLGADEARDIAEEQATWSRLPRAAWSWLARLASEEGWANALAFQLVVATALLRLLWLNQPSGSLIFDELYYVNAARVILGWEVPEGMPYAGAEPGHDPNVEHLPLAKVIIAGSMRAFGDNAYGWRLPSVLFGTLAVAALYLMVRRLTRRPWLALFAAFIFSFDNLVFVHGRIATLDIFMLALLLLGLYAYVARRPALAGIALALSTLAKFSGIFGLLTIGCFEALRLALQPAARAHSRRTVADLLIVSGAFTVAFLTVLWPLDHAFSGFASPVQHVAYVYSYGVSLHREDGPQGIESLPWQWLANQVPIPYLRQEVNTLVDGKVVASRATVSFVGEMNPFIIGMLPLVLAYLLHAALSKRDDLSLLLLALLATTYLPPFASAVLFHRISYIFYFLPVLPALCAGIAYLLLDLRLPRLLPLAYAASVLLGFVVLFPFQTVP